MGFWTRLSSLLLAIALLFSSAGLVNAAKPANAGKATPWRVYVQIYRSVDAECRGTQMQWNLSNTVIDPTAVANRFSTTVKDWSNGNGIMQLTIVEAGTLTSVSPVFTNDCWASPSDVSLPAGYDSYIVMYDTDSDTGLQLNGYGGLAYTCGECVQGGTYATTYIADGLHAWHWDTSYPEKILIHEWMNGSMQFFRDHGANIPNQYNAQQYGYEPGSPEWYSALLSGFNYNGEMLGATKRVWRLGTPQTI